MRPRAEQMQMYSVLHTLEWALMVTAREWQSLFLIRADLELKADLRLYVAHDVLRA